MTPEHPDAAAGDPPTATHGTGPGGDNAAGSGGEGGEAAGAGRRRKRPARRLVLEWAVIIVLAVVVALVVRDFVFQTFYIPSGSMEPTLKIGDRIVVDKLSYHLHGVGRGDVVVFRRPPAENCGGPPVPDLVKRVIGLPTETISAHGGSVYINGHLLAEPWLPKEYARTSTFPPVKIPKGDYFMMGDHRTDSCDSRMWGPLPGSYIVGKVVLRVWPLDRIAFF